MRLAGMPTHRDGARASAPPEYTGRSPSVCSGTPERIPPVTQPPLPSSSPIPAPSSSSSSSSPASPSVPARRSVPLLSWTPAAIVFDCDGTLMDTERHWQDARGLTLREYGLRAAAGFAERAKGLHYAECGQLMADEANRPELGDALTGTLLAHFRTLVAARPATMPGAPELVAQAAAFAPLAVASNCPVDVVETCLSTAGLLTYFDHIVVPDAAVRPKPAPDVYLVAARLCGVEPARCLAVEDSACGVRAAVRAGLRVMGVGPWPEQGAATSVDLWVDRLDDPDVLAWAGRRAAEAREKARAQGRSGDQGEALTR